MSERASIITLIILFGGILLAMIFLLIYSLNRFVLNKEVVNRKEKIISLGAASLLFMNTLQIAVVDTGVRLLASLQELFFRLKVPIKTSGTQEATVAVAASDRATMEFSLADVFNKFPFSRLLIFIAFYVLFYYLLLLVRDKVTLKGGQTTQVQPMLFVNLSICLLLVFSLYLVVSVFVAIPYLNESRKPTAYTRDRLDSALSRMENRDSFALATSNPSPFNVGNARDTILKDQLKHKYDSLGNQQQKVINVLVNYFQIDLNNIKSSRQRTVSEMMDFVKNYRQNEADIRMRLLIGFETNVQSLIVDKSALYLATLNTFENYVATCRREYAENLRDLFSADQHNLGEIQRTLENFKYLINSFVPGTSSSQNDSSLFESYGPFKTDWLSFKQYTPALQKVSYFNTLLPTYEKDGSDWGFFGNISKYLIRTQSSELVLLIGMFGFGLLGASILSFTQIKSVHEFATQPIIDNFFNVLARGFGAALVVYMSIKGGLTIFTGGVANDANGYILLLTCFAAAIFSEKIWTKLKDWVAK